MPIRLPKVFQTSFSGTSAPLIRAAGILKSPCMPKIFSPGVSFTNMWVSVSSIFDIRRVYGSLEIVGIRNFAKFSGIAGLALSLSACSTSPDPFLNEVTAVVSGSVFSEPVASSYGCIQLSGIFCRAPMHDLVFVAPAETDAEFACTQFVTFATKLGAIAYSTNDGVGDSAELPTDKTEVINLCANGLASPLKNWDGSVLYQGLALQDDGAQDAIGKYYSLGRGLESVGDKRFNLTISFSRDLNRIGPINYGTKKPALMTQSELDALGDINSIAAETMKTANSLQGMKEADAIAAIEAAGYSWVLVDRDGEELPTDKSYDPRRIRLIIREGIIYDAVAG